MAIDRKKETKKIILASDHAGFKLKEEIKNFLIKKRKKVLDLGTKNTNSVDYPDYAKVRLELFPDGGPASSTVFISGLVRSEFLIEIEAFAVLGD